MPPTSSPTRNAPLQTPLDTRYQVETPEGIDLPLRPAGLPVRAVAFAIDLGVRGVILGALLSVLTLLDKFGAGLGSIILFLVSWWYMVLFEVLNQGRSPGKQLMGLRVVHDDGTPVGWSASLTRNLLRFVDMLPFGYCLGALSCLQHPTFKRLGDLAGGTLVIYREQPLSRPTLPEAVPRTPVFALRLNEQRALLSFAERQGELSAERVNELAGLLAPALRVPPSLAVTELNGIARGLLGPT
ncbi:RDD family protein [Pseudomonas gingeri NCPPB 3146 = LMG 5327]|uniref:RDD family protein n=2 Tax=Pseudomonas gingeri TaxID=117681 RepID=A0A7Y8CEU2_9PSED|nr:RDD family protein [Pseudomonas gingeri]NVZ29822.1 RDD family protein [Pseudomonas gingeri]NVZ63547.1 RDD family protein [Pseudomonas gingeri]NVZ78030.1 RDD family protein [Pseudomonas gingeri]NWA10864.1 RDD family protein [Pseudomonas gingeri]NWC16615.1 RDD family protein [Pseudomonas gingeri]